MGSPPVPPGAPQPASWGPPPRQGGAPPLQAQTRRAIWPLIVGVLVLVVAAVVSTAAVTYAVTRPSNGPLNASGPQETQHSPTEQADAKDRVCRVFEDSVRGKEGQGGVVVNGELNIPLVLRKINGVVAVQNALTPATPSEISDAAEKYIENSLELTTAATKGDTPIDELVRLTKTGNTATYALADLCGIPR